VFVYDASPTWVSHRNLLGVILETSRNFLGNVDVFISVIFVRTGREATLLSAFVFRFVLYMVFPRTGHSRRFYDVHCRFRRTCSLLTGLRVW
jgi:hypothetical protein